MSLSNIIAILALAVIDAFNPATIATMMLLLPMVKEKWHSLIFVAGTYLVYFISGFIVFIGIDIKCTLCQGQFGFLALQLNRYLCCTNRAYPHSCKRQVNFCSFR